MQARQLLTLSGLASVIVIVIAFAGLSGETPGTDKSGEEIKTFWVDHSSRQTTAAYVLMAALPLLIIFASAVRSLLAESTGGSSIWRNVFFGGALMTAGGFAVAAALHLAVASSPEDLGIPAIQAINAIDEQSYLAFTGGIGVMLIGAGGAMIPVASGLRWLGWIALVLGVLIFTPVGFIAFIGAGLWIALTSVALTMRQRGPQRRLATS